MELICGRTYEEALAIESELLNYKVECNKRRSDDLPFTYRIEVSDSEIQRQKRF